MNLSAKTKNEASKHLIQQVTTGGPLPVAQQFEQYEKVLPGSAERIISMAEKEQGNRFLNDQKSHEINEKINEINKKIVDNNHKEKLFGIIAAFIVSTLIITSGIFLILQGHDGAGTTVIASTLVGVIVAFVGSKFSKIN